MHLRNRIHRWPHRSNFERVSLDVFEMNIKDKKRRFLITVDHYSDYFEIDDLKDLSAVETVKVCKRNFSSHEIPLVCVIDGGTNFTSQQFKYDSQKHRWPEKFLSLAVTVAKYTEHDRRQSDTKDFLTGDKMRTTNAAEDAQAKSMSRCQTEDRTESCCGQDTVR